MLWQDATIYLQYIVKNKRKAFNLVHKNQYYEQLDTFTMSNSTHEEVKKAGESFILKLYAASNFKSLSE